MRKNWRNNLIGVLIMVLAHIFTYCKENHDHAGAGVTYTCPMHPQIVKPAPGSCPICGMDLVARQPKNTVPLPIVSDLNYLLRPTNQFINANIKTITPAIKATSAYLTLPGIITYDTRRQYTIPARVGGRIEKLYVQFNYQPVRKGQKLYEIYSPTLITAQNELIYLLQHDAQNVELIRAAEQKLFYLGATQAQLNQIKRQQKVSFTFSVYSPYNGYVVDPTINPAPGPNLPPGNTNNNPTGAGMTGMANNTPGNIASGSPAVISPADKFLVREGMYVNEGQTLFKIINAEEIWAEFNVRPTEMTHVVEGTPLTIEFNQTSTDSVNTRVYLVQPFYQGGASFGQVRALLPGKNKNALVGQLVTGKVKYATGEALWIPQSALLDLGNTTVVFQQVAGGFQPQAVVVDQRANGLVAIKSGINAQTAIAANAQYLVDSESFIRVAENQ